MDKLLQTKALVEERKGEKMTAIASEEVEDRMDEILSMDGWELENYKRNPVLLWSHDPKEPAVGKADNIRIENWGGKKKLVFEPDFHGQTPLSDALRKLYINSFLNAFSVGFLPKEQKDNVYTRQELLEISCVNVPALPTALILGRAIKDFKFKSYKDNQGTIRYKTQIECPECKEIRWIDKRNIQKGIDEENFTGLCQKCLNKKTGKDANGYKEGKWHQSNGYIGILASEIESEFQCMKDSRGYIYEHRYIMAKKLGRPLKEWEQVHHLNGIKDDNRQENLELIGGDDGEHLLITKMQKRIKELEEITEIKPFPEEHSCRLNPPDKYDRFARKNCYVKHDGKCIDFIFGIKSGKSEVQAMRYGKDVWTTSEASSHCKSKGGSFEAAAGKLGQEIDYKKEIKELKKTIVDLEAALKKSQDQIKPPCGENKEQGRKSGEGISVKEKRQALNIAYKALEYLLRHEK